MKPTTYKELIEELSKEHNIDYNLLYDFTNHVYQELVEEIESCKIQKVVLYHLGSFRADYKKVKREHINRKEKLDLIRNNSKSGKNKIEEYKKMKNLLMLIENEMETKYEVRCRYYENLEKENKSDNKK